MIFVRIVVSLTRDRVNAVMTQDLPFERGMVQAAGEECEIFDLGVVDDHEWRDRDDAPCGPHRHMLHRLEDLGMGALALLELRVRPAPRAIDEPHPLAAALGVRRIVDCPCSMATLKDRLRASGPEGVPTMARAWLANVLPPATVAELGIGRAVPMSARRAAEALRNRRDPHSGSRMPQLERQAAKHEEARRAAAARARARKVKPLKEPNGEDPLR